NSVNHVVRLNFGSIDVSICAGISMREALGIPLPGSRGGLGYRSLSSSLLKEHALYTSLCPAEQKRLRLSLAHRVCFEMNQRLVISATSIVATILLTNLNRGISRRDHTTDRACA